MRYLLPAFVLIACVLYLSFILYGAYTSNDEVQAYLVPVLVLTACHGCLPVDYTQCLWGVCTLAMTRSLLTVCVVYMLFMERTL